MKRFEGRTAFVTGGSRGIGAALCVALAREGCNVAIAAKTAEPNPKLPGTIHETAAAVEAAGGRALPLIVDVRHEEQVDAAVDATAREFGGIDILINNAGAISLTDLENTPAKRFDLMMAVNARAAHVCSRAAVRHMKKKRYGHILMLSPPADVKSAPGRAAYVYSKIGMTFFAHSFAEELAEFNIAANALWPITAIDTAAVRNFQFGSESDYRKPEILVDAALVILSREPSQCTGRAYYDEDVLKESGVSDFSKYSVVSGANPAPLSRMIIAGY